MSQRANRPGLSDTGAGGARSKPLEIASTCGVNAALLAGIAKEIIDLSGLGTPSIEDLVADYSGIACARQGADASFLQDCRRCCSARWGQP